MMMKKKILDTSYHEIRNNGDEINNIHQLRHKLRPTWTARETDDKLQNEPANTH